MLAKRASRAGYRWRAIAENIAAGQMNAAVAVQGWLNSRGHCANLMSPVYTEMGAAFAVNDPFYSPRDTQTGSVATCR